MPRLKIPDITWLIRRRLTEGVNGDSSIKKLQKTEVGLKSCISDLNMAVIGEYDIGVLEQESNGNQMAKNGGKKSGSEVLTGGVENLGGEYGWLSELDERRAKTSIR
ncbi:hypothetical protein OROGR_032519 [Orobanche gracilis]